MSQSDETLDYTVSIPLGQMSHRLQTRFWVVEGRIRSSDVSFDTGFVLGKKYGCAAREWSLDWSLEGSKTPQQLMENLKRENIPFTVRVSVRD